MSLAVVWSYFHALWERASPMARRFVVIAPNLTVFERLKEDFRPEGGGPDIFMRDPLIPPEWRGDWNLPVVLQDEAGGAVTGGALYLTNIHRLFDAKDTSDQDSGEWAWAGPAVSPTTALDTGAELRDRIAGHDRVMVLNDEAHHIWDPNSSWNKAIRSIHTTLYERFGKGLSAQLDFSATPKDNRGRVFRHIVCDTPLGEAVDAGIIKTPIIGRTGQLIEQPHDDAGMRYEAHLRVGYERWRRSREEWRGSGKLPLLFVMCENTAAADQIARRLNADPIFDGLNGKTINLHTNLKGRIRKRNIGGQTISVFEESEKSINDEDLRAIRSISRALDRPDSPYACIVSVLMLREGWDVRNVTTIVPLRPYSSKANILPEQTLGRGLRRMTPPGSANELVTVIEHPAFTNLYQQELEQEGLDLQVIDSGRVPPTTVSIFPDECKDWQTLNIHIPFLSAAYSIRSYLESITVEEIREEFRRFQSLPLRGKRAAELSYEGRHLITNEVVEKMKISLPLLQNGLTAVSFFRRELEMACKIRNTQGVLVPLLKTFLSEILFGQKIELTDSRLAARLADRDVHEHVRAVFIPPIRKRIIVTNSRRPEAGHSVISEWKSFQATISERRPAFQANKTLFNLVPCDSSLEVAMTRFLDDAPDIRAFAKNAGPQALRMDYLSRDLRPALYTADFMVALEDGGNALVETKGREDSNVPRKAKAAVEWCEQASKSGTKWSYVYLPQNVMEGLTESRFKELTRAAAPALSNLLSELTVQPELPLFSAKPQAGEAEQFFSKAVFDSLPAPMQEAATEALELYRFLERKGDSTDLAPVFTPLLRSIEETSKTVILASLRTLVPNGRQAQDIWFDPQLDRVESKSRRRFTHMAKNLRRSLMHDNPVSVIGLLRSCFDYALNDKNQIGGIFEAVRSSFRFEGARKLSERVSELGKFRNDHVAHSKTPLTNRSLAEAHLRQWVETLAQLQARLR